jgi:hypothetical protein
VQEKERAGAALPATPNSRKRAKVSAAQGASGIGSNTSNILPLWYTKFIDNRYTVNSTMPCLAKIKENLVEQVPELKSAVSKVRVYRCSGVHCPAHLYHENALYVHHSNGIYVGIQVYMCVYVCVYKFVHPQSCPAYPC